jgi:hypothetical protein
LTIFTASRILFTRTPLYIIIGGDFNCVADTNLDTKTAAGIGSTTYRNAHSVQVEALMAHYGLTDIYRLYHGNKAGGYSRYRHTGIATRMNRPYLLPKTPLPLEMDLH